MSEIVDFSPESDEFDEMDADLEDYIGKALFLTVCFQKDKKITVLIIRVSLPSVIFRLRCSYGITVMQDSLARQGNRDHKTLEALHFFCPVSSLS